MEGMTGTVVVYSTTWCSDCRRAKEFLNRNQVPFVNINIEEDLQAMSFVERVNNGMHMVPTIVFPDGSVLAEPSNAQLADKVGLLQ